MELSITTLADRITNESEAYLFMEQLRWGDTPFCPHCGSTAVNYIRPLNGVSRKTRTGAASQRRVWKCQACPGRKQFSALTGTIFHGSKVSVRKWLFVFFEVCSSKNGVAAREIERKYDLTAKTAWFMLHRIREAMKRDPLVGMLSGTIVADETFVGGKPKNRHRSRREQDNVIVPAQPGIDVGNIKTDKTAVFSLVDKATGEVRSRVVPDVSGASLRKAMAEQVDFARSHLETDGWKAYKGIGTEFASHQAVDHTAGEYVRGTVSTNMAEGYFSQLKRSIDGTHHHVSVEHLPRYLAEFDYRFTTRKLSDTTRMRALMGQVGDRRLTYRPIVTGRG